jgi:TetR/AcrR family transcriptional regulator, regulator of cefoperazone and chloramphenicol sensitivity
MSQSTPSEQDTKTTLLLTAAQLFAERGYAGASVREIVRRAGATLSAVNYHFGSKERLYAEAVRYVTEGSIKIHELGKDIDTKEFATPQEASDAIALFFRRLLLAMLGPDQPEWAARLHYRALADEHDGATQIYDEVFAPVLELIASALHRAAPSSSKEECRLVVLAISGMAHHLSAARTGICHVLGIEGYDKPFLIRTSDLLINSLLVHLGLPEPNIKGLT